MNTIIGINGSIGEGLANELVKRGEAVRGISRRPFPGHWEHRQADALDYQELLGAVQGSKVVYLCLGLKYEIKVWRRDWPIAMENAIRVCLATGAKLVFLDNVYMYGRVIGEMTEENPNRPTSEKGKVRAQIADMLMSAVRDKGLKATIGRAADFYGPKCANSVLNMMVIDNLAKGKKASWIGRDDVVHSYTFTPDIFRSLATLGLDERANGQIWHLPTHANPWTGKEYIKKIAEALHVDAKYSKMGDMTMAIGGLFNPLAREAKEMMYQYNFDYVFSSAKYESVFGDVTPTAYQEGIDLCVNSLMVNG